MGDAAEQTCVALMVRAPIPGRVKTRLAAVIGPEAACELYLAMVADILDGLRDCGLPLLLFHDHRAGDSLPESWRRAADRVLTQRGGDIGMRMAGVFADSLALGFAQVILIGSDIPELASRHIRLALEGLAGCQAALAPAADGGYCLIALSRSSYQSQLFADIPWSSGQVLASTLARFRELGLAPRLLPTLRDIDTIEDLRACLAMPWPEGSSFFRAASRLLAQGAEPSSGDDSHGPSA